MTHLTVQKIRDATGLNGWHYTGDQTDSYQLDISSLGMPFQTAKGFEQTLAYYYSELSSRATRHPEHEVHAVYDKELELAAAAEAALLATQHNKAGAPSAPWGAVPRVIMFSGDVQGGEYGGPDHIAISMTIPGGFARNQRFLSYLKEFRAAQQVFSMIRDGLGRPR